MNVSCRLVFLIATLSTFTAGASLSEAADKCKPAAHPDKAAVSNIFVTLEDLEDEDFKPVIDCEAAIRNACEGYFCNARVSLSMGRNFSTPGMEDRPVWYVEIQLDYHNDRYSEEVIVIDAMTGKRLIDFSYR